MSVVTPQNLTYLNRSKYITPAEFKRSPIASAIDTTQLIPNGDLAVQDHALNDLISQASAYADNYTLGAIGTLGATVNTESGRFRANRQGSYTIHPAFWPILEVRSFKVGGMPSLLADIPLSTNNCWIEQRQFIITQGAYYNTSAGPLSLAAFPTGQAAFAQYTYVNGFFNQGLSAQATAGSSSLTFADVTGLYPGSPITIYDAPVEESVSVSTSWNGTALTVPLNDPLAYNHGVGTNVSALPPTVKQAVIHIVVSMIKQRGEGGLVLNEIGEPMMVSSRTQTSALDLDRAHDLLSSFKQIWGRV
jgi:hypothetical protein